MKHVVNWTWADPLRPHIEEKEITDPAELRALLRALQDEVEKAPCDFKLIYALRPRDPFDAATQKVLFQLHCAAGVNRSAVGASDDELVEGGLVYHFYTLVDFENHLCPRPHVFEEADAVADYIRENIPTTNYIQPVPEVPVDERGNVLLL